MATKIEEGEVGTESGYQSKTEAEIKELALGLRAGNMMGTWQVNQNDIGMVFMPLLLGDDLFYKEIERDKIVHFYSRIDGDHTFPRGVNGMPCFHRIYPLDRADTNRLKAAIEALEAFMGKSDATD